MHQERERDGLGGKLDLAEGFSRESAFGIERFESGVVVVILAPPRSACYLERRRWGSCDSTAFIRRDCSGGE